jgi:hypothetical protein
MSAASALMLATEASRIVAARRRFILEERRIRLKSRVVVLAWLLFEIYELYGIEIEHVIEHVFWVLVMVDSLVMVDLGLARAETERVGGGRLTTVHGRSGLAIIIIWCGGGRLMPVHFANALAMFLRCTTDQMNMSTQATQRPSAI